MGENTLDTKDTGQNMESFSIQMESEGMANTCVTSGDQHVLLTRIERRSDEEESVETRRDQVRIEREITTRRFFRFYQANISF